MTIHSSTQISVIVPIYKTPLIYFKECLDSLCNQTMRDTEFILVFDGENKELLSICETYKKKDNRFKIFIQPHLGVSNTRNFGIEQAGGKYIAFVDADDILCSNILNEAYTFAEKNMSDVTIWDCSIYDGNKAERRSMFDCSIGQLSSSQRNDVLRSVISMKDPNWISTAGPWCKLYQKKLLRETPFESTFILRQDRILNIKLFSKDISISYLHKNGYLYRIHSESAVRKFRHNLLQISLTFIDAMKDITGDFYLEGIGLETYRSLWEAWFNSILNPHNPQPLIQRVYEFNKILKSNHFRRYLSKIEDYGQFTIPEKIELFLLRKGWTISMWLRSIIWNAMRIFK